MYGNLRILTLSLSVLFCAPTTSAQQYFFQSFDAVEGLGTTTINDLEEDPAGFIWIGTEGSGLIRFDGRGTKMYTTENGLPSNYVTVLRMLGDSAMIVGTDKGVRYFDGLDLSKRWKSLPEDRLVDFCYAGSDLYFAFRKSLWRIRDTTITEINIPGNPELYALEHSGSGALIAGTSVGLIRVEQNEAELLWNKGVVRSIFISEDIPGLPEGEQLLFGAQNDVYYRTNSGAFERYTSLTAEVPPMTDVRDITITDKVLWLGSYRDGLWRTQMFGGKLIIDHLGESNGLMTPKVRSLLLSHDERLWIGALGGLGRLVSPDIYRISADNGLTDERIHALQIDVEGRWWMGGADGLSMREPDGTVRKYDESDGFPKGLVFDIEIDRSGVLWIATERGLVKKTGNRFRLYGREGGSPDVFVFDIQSLPDNTLALATTEGIYTFRSGRFKSLDRRLENATFMRIQRDTQNRIWALSAQGDLRYLEGQSWVFPLDSNLMRRISVSTFVIAPDGVLWMGTNGSGLWRWDGKYLDSLSEKDGLLSNQIESVLDDGRAVWVGTEKGIQHVEYSGNEWRFGVRISKAQGIRSMECYRHVATRRNESVYFGTGQGVLVVPEPAHREVPHSGRIQLLTMDLFFRQPDSWQPFAEGLKAWSGMPYGIELPYNQNYIRFNYSAMGVADPTILHYEYRLLPLSKEWTKAGNRAEAIYTSVPPGKYTFEVRAFDTMSGQTVYSEPLSFHIAHPYWKTWWFYTLVTLTVTALVFLYIRLRLRRMRIRMKMEEEISDLERRALRLQMNPHFVFNALDAISGFIFKNNPEEAVKYLNNFAKLMRLTLESSREHFIPLHTEIQLLENYLALEKLRFNGEFTSEIAVSEDLDTYGISIPSMMVQPHVENAILHGLRARGPGGSVHIQFKINSQGLACVVEDNGVGRAASEVIQQKGGRKYQSLAGEISKRRLQLFEKSLGTRSSVAIEDLFDTAGNPAGTRVTLWLPVKFTDEWAEDADA